MKFLNLIFLFLTLFSSFCFSQTETEEVRAVVIGADFIDDVASQVVGYDNSIDELEFIIDPKEKVKDIPDRSFDELLQISDMMNTYDFEKLQKGYIMMPISSKDRLLVASLRNLDNETLQRFLDKKTNHLRKIAKVLAFFGYSPQSINARLEKFNDTFFRRPHLIANANSVVITPGLFTAAGVGLNDRFTNWLRQFPKLDKLPEKSGFYVALSFGVSFVAYRKSNGAFRFRIEPGFDFRVGREITSPYALVAAGFTGMMSIEDRRDSNLTLLKAEFDKRSAPTIVSGERILALSLPFGWNPIPFGGLAAGIHGDYSRLQLTPSSIPILLRGTKAFLVNGYKSCKKAVEKIF